MLTYLAVFGMIFAINVLPAFGPPTWLVLVVLHVSWDCNVVALVVVGGTSACCGRYVLARSARRLKPHLPKRYVRGVERAGKNLANKNGQEKAVIGVFFVSPLPPAQLFIAAGLCDLPLIPVTLAFGLGRMVIYSLYLALASVAITSLSGAFGDFFGSPWLLAVEVLLMALTIVGPLLLAKGDETT